MTRQEVYNFAAGPSVLPTPALERARDELLNYNGSGMSVMEMSHRSSIYQGIFDSTKAKFKAAFSVPDSHEILFLQGGASTQFSMVPLNLMGENGKADYAVTGNFATIAMKEAKKYGTISIAADTTPCGHTRIPTQAELTLDPDAKYFYYCSNNTIYGTEWSYVPDTGNVPIVCDMSSDILSRPVDVSKYGIIFAGAQKNMAPAGLTVVVIDRALAGHEMPMTPLMLSYARMIEKDSMYNTPPCWNIYMLGLVLDWLESQGGVPGMEKIKAQKATLLYDFLDESRIFKAKVEPGSRSDMNVTFKTDSAELDAEFVKEATANGLLNLKGHRVAGGMRASIYNAMPLEGVVALRDFMKEFEVRHRV
jgi:phosphoserine aminotransferase